LKFFTFSSPARSVKQRKRASKQVSTTNRIALEHNRDPGAQRRLGTIDRIFFIEKQKKAPKGLFRNYMRNVRNLEYMCRSSFS